MRLMDIINLLRAVPGDLSQRQSGDPIVNVRRPLFATHVVPTGKLDARGRKYEETGANRGLTTPRRSSRAGSMKTYGMKGILAAMNRRETLIGAVAIFSAGLQRQAWAIEQIGKVTEIRGIASAEAAAGTRPLAADGPVFLAELLRTGDESRLGLHLGASNLSAAWRTIETAR